MLFVNSTSIFAQDTDLVLYILSSEVFFGAVYIYSICQYFGVISSYLCIFDNLLTLKCYFSV